MNGHYSDYMRKAQLDECSVCKSHELEGQTMCPP